MKFLRIIFVFVFLTAACGQEAQNQTKTKNSQAQTVPVGKGPDALFLTPDETFLYVANVDENEFKGAERDSLKKLRDIAEADQSSLLLISGKIEEEIAQLEENEREAYLASLGLKESGLDRLVREGHRMLGLIAFFTVGPKENRAWTVREGTRAPQAAGKIHR